MSETIFDRLGKKLVKSAANLALISQQISISENLAAGIVQSQIEIEGVNAEAIIQIEARAIEIEQATIAQLNAIQALQEGQDAQIANRQMMEVMAGHLGESNLTEIKDEIKDIATLLGYGNYAELLKGDVELWTYLLFMVYPDTFAKAFGKQLGLKQKELFTSLRKNINALQRTDGILDEPE